MIQQFSKGFIFMREKYNNKIEELSNKEYEYVLTESKELTKVKTTD